MQTSVIQASFDGSCEPRNPGGVMGQGWLVDGVPYSSSIPAAPGNTNNISEYLALTRLLEHIVQHREDCTELYIYGDSQLVIKQIREEWQVQVAAPAAALYALPAVN